MPGFAAAGRHTSDSAPSRSSLPLPHVEELLQADRVRLIGANLEAVDVCPAEPARQSLLALLSRFREQCPHPRVARVEFQQFIGLGVAQRQKADVRHRRFARVAHGHRDTVVPLVGDRQGP